MKLDGNLILNADATGQIENLYVERLSSAPAFSSSQVGRIYFDTSYRAFYYNNGSAWVALSSGGGGGGSGSTTLAGLLDVSITSPSNKQYLQFNTSQEKWNNTTLVLADVSDVTSTAAEVNVLHGFTGTTANLNILSGTAASGADLSSIAGYAAENISPTVFGYLSGVTSSIQTQINNLQAANSGLNAFGVYANGSSTGLVVKTGVDTFASVTLTSNNSNLIISNGNGPSNPTFSLAGNLESLATLTGVGLVTYSSSGTLGVTSLSAASSGTITITNGNGAGSPTIGLSAVAQSFGGTPLKVTIDGYGRVTSSSPIVQSDITNILGTYYLPTAGGSMTGPIIFNNTSGTTVTGLPSPVNSSDAATKAYVDAAASSLIVHSAVAVATTGSNLPLTYSNGSSGVGATLSSATAITLIDNVALTLNMRVLVKDQTTQFQNGVYTVTSLSSPFTLTRASDANTGSITSMVHGFYVFVNGGGTVNGSTSWTETAVGSGAGGAFNIGTDSIVFTQFSAAGTYLAGAGLVLNGGTFSVDYGAGITALPSGDVGLNVYGGALILTTNGSTSNPVAGSSLALLLASGGGLIQSSGLAIATGGVTNSMLASSSISLTAGVGSGSMSLGGTHSLLGDGAAISTSVTGSAVTISAAKATTSSVGVASFTSSTFAVSGAGQVSIVNGSITNGQLVNDSWNINGTTGGAQPVLLGSSLSIVGGTTPITTASSAGVLTINVAAATTTALGLASFVSSYFTVASGAVSIRTTLGSGAVTNVNSTVDTAANGDLLQYSTTNSKWSNVPAATVLSNAGFKNQYYLYTASSALITHTVVHNLGQQYCVVQVIDQTPSNLNYAIMPANIYFQDLNTVVVTFTQATLCKIAVVS